MLSVAVIRGGLPQGEWLPHCHATMEHLSNTLSIIMADSHQIRTAAQQQIIQLDSSEQLDATLC